ncbi:activating signal cointegrator 1 complex subunit, partial [Pimephales promelas]
KHKVSRDESSKPIYGCQVTIQSEQERQMMKIYRKEEKKERKREKRGDEGESCESAFHFDPVELRLQRRVAR